METRGIGTGLAALYHLRDGNGKALSGGLSRHDDPGCRLHSLYDGALHVLQAYKPVIQVPTIIKGKSPPVERAATSSHATPSLERSQRTEFDLAQHAGDGRERADEHKTQFRDLLIMSIAVKPRLVDADAVEADAAGERDRVRRSVPPSTEADAAGERDRVQEVRASEHQCAFDGERRACRVRGRRDEPVENIHM